MTTNQAKRIAGITFDTKGEDGRQRALSEIKRKIIAARRAGDDDRAAELSGAQSVFKGKRTNHCPVCGVRIGRGATHCREHSKPTRKAIPCPAGQTPEAKGRRVRRVDIVPEAANLGFYTAPVQHVVKAWLAKGVRLAWIQQTFVDVAQPIRFRIDQQEIRVAHYGLWPMAFELGSAIARVLNDKGSLDYWLLTRDQGRTNGQFRSLAEIRQTIIARGGPTFTPANIRQGLSRLRLVTPKEVAKDFRDTVTR